MKKVGYCDTCNNTGEIDCYCGGDLCVCGAQVEPCPKCDGGDFILGDYDDPEEIWDDDFDCGTCRGTGFVNPLTAPADFFCTGTTDCPSCDGSGRM